MQLEDLGLIGNCQYSALVHRSGSLVWCCFPRFDSEPVFGKLLDPEGGEFVIGPADNTQGTQRYLDNTNVLETSFVTDGGQFRIIDFAPRFYQHGRSFRPTQIHRIIEPISGTPRIRVNCQPILGWNKENPTRTFGSNHIRFEGFPSQLRLTTDIPLSYLDGKPFTLTERRHVVLTWGAPIEEPITPLCERFLKGTIDYWIRWTKQLNIPAFYQKHVIRSALVLKIHCFEDTGAIIAATTTSIPESPGSGRTWDYRFCWLRDAFYTLRAFRLLGQFEEREQFIQYLINIVGGSADLKLSPLYRIDGTQDLEEHILHNWQGYLGEKPVRIGNAAALQAQNDIFGEMVLALAPVFVDDRLIAERSDSTLKLLERLTRKAIEVAGTPDAGIWEVRTENKPQTFSSLMCWAAADRMARISERYSPDKTEFFKTSAERIRNDMFSHAWSAKLGSLTATYGTEDLDAALLQAVSLNLFSAEDPRSHTTTDAVRRALEQNGWMHRYAIDDGFGKPEVAFVLCTYWLIDALAKVGRKSEAHDLFTKVQHLGGSLGLIAEDYDPTTQRMWGNFPQAYSHVGLIHAAFAASPAWDQIL